ncbi:MAG: shikimate kinase [Gemmatimonadetes bacterium]|nr:shikimate kinase [Gemmatimonadota bacterium]
MRRHLVLVGLPGAGKSTAGRLLAARLDSHLSDIDLVLVRATGLSVAEQIAEAGEADFRAREHQAVVEALGLPPHVIAPGGGWAARPGRLATLGEGSLAVHLDVAPAVAAARLAADPIARPLLAGDLGGRLEQLALDRAPWYRAAPVTIDVTGRTAAEVADLLLEVAKSRAGW